MSPLASHQAIRPKSKTLSAWPDHTVYYEFEHLHMYYSTTGLAQAPVVQQRLDNNPQSPQVFLP